MAQTSGWLLLGVMKFERMPFLAMIKEAKMRVFVNPGELLTIEARIGTKARVLPSPRRRRASARS